jgi:hypothetical protein
MNLTSPITSIVRLGAGAVAVGAAGWAGIAGLTWLRYGRTRSDLGQVPSLDAFMPEAEVDECHQIVVEAPADVTFAAACELDLQSSPVNAAIIAIRTLPARVRGEPIRVQESKGLLAETLALGWGRLVEDPGRELVMGAVCQPWEGEVTFTPLPPDEFAGFGEPGFVKIAWTLSAESIGPHETLFQTRTRVMTTDADSRRRFRRYWAIFSPGILLIRLEALRLVKIAAEEKVAQPAALPEPKIEEPDALQAEAVTA